MTSNSQKQSGIAHIFIILIIIVVLIGALGFVFWNNFLRKGSSTDVKTDMTTKSDNASKKNVSETESITGSTTLVDMGLMTSDNLGIKYKLPSSWSGGKYGGGDTLSDSESTTLTSPDGFTITMTISRLIRGWTYDSPAATILEVQKATGTGLNWVIVDHNDGTSGPISLQIVSTQDLPKVGDKKVAGSSIYKLGEADGSGVYLEMYGEYKTDMSLANFNAKESVIQAKTIFESVSIGV